MTAQAPSPPRATDESLERRFKHWTSEEITALRRLWRNGKTDEQIAEAFGSRSALSVRAKRRDLGLERQ